MPGQVDLARNRGAALPAHAVGVHAYGGQQAQVTIDNTEKSLLDAALTLPASGSRYQAGDLLVITAIVSLTQNSGATRVWTARTKLGATTLTSSPLSIGVNASTRLVVVTARVLLTAINAQRAHVDWNVSAAASPWDGYATASGSDIGTGAEDMSTSKTIDLTIQSAAATATQNARVDQITVVHLPYTT